VRLSGRYVGQNIGAEGIIGYLYVFVTLQGFFSGFAGVASNPVLPPMVKELCV